MEEDQVYGAHRTVTLLGDDQFGESLEILAIAIVDFFAEDEAHHVGILLDEVAEDRRLSSARSSNLICEIQEDQLMVARRAVALLGDDQLRESLEILAIAIVGASRKMK